MPPHMLNPALVSGIGGHTNPGRERATPSYPPESGVGGTILVVSFRPRWPNRSSDGRPDPIKVLIQTWQ